jgi:DNA-binding transcriptional ArsR family regulator
MSRPNTSRVLKNAAPVFAALGDATRLLLVGRLIDGQTLSIAQLADGLDLTRQGVTKHLHVLQRAGIVRARSVGRESQFSYVAEPIDRARSYLDGVSRQWDDALSRLKTHLQS